MLAPGLPDLLEAVVVVSADTHSINILRNKRMVIARQGKPIHVDRSLVARIGTQSETHEAVDGTTLRLLQADQITHDDVRAGNSSDARSCQSRPPGGLHIA